MEGTIYSLIPPILMIVLVLLTRRVFISLGIGIIVGALLLENFHPWESLKAIWLSFQTNFYADGAWDWWSIQLVLFLLLLGILIAFLTASGGAKAFGDWAVQRVKTRNGSQLMTAFIGLVIFIDDYFSSLTIGQVSRPITDRKKVSRAKLAYLIDSTAAPVTVITPISSWGAYIIGLMGTIIATHELTDFSPFTAFIQTIPFNYYAIAAILLVFAVILLKLDFGPMRTHEARAVKTGELIDPENANVPGDLQSEVYENPSGKVSYLIVPLAVLIVSTVGMMIYTGIQASGETGFIAIFAETDVNLSLVTGGLLSVLVGLFFYLRVEGKKTSFDRVVVEGIKAMLPAIYILVLAWMIAGVIGELGTGDYLAELVQEANMNVAYLPLILFIVAGLMAFATGTSWGTFGIMLPIAGTMAATIDPALLIPAMGAVLAGSVFGDHCSPISDTTVLSSTGAGSNHIDHVLTQIPYALIAALASIVGYLLYAFTGSMLVGLGATVLSLLLFAYLIKTIFIKEPIEE